MRLVVVLALGWTITSGHTAEFKSIVQEEDALILFADLLARSVKTGDDDAEVAAFLVREENGRLRCLLWPRLASRRSEGFTGIVPKGVFAVVHTHPLTMTEPSRNDLREAKRIGLPIYVLTRWTIFLADPETGQSIDLVGKKNWSRGRSGPGVCESGWGKSHDDSPAITPAGR